MKFKKLLSTVCSFTMLFSSLFSCKAAPVDSFRCTAALIGDTRAGKTKLFAALTTKEETYKFDDEYNPGQGPAIGSLKSDDERFHLCLYDLCGNHKLVDLCTRYLKNADIRFVYIVLDTAKDDWEGTLSKWLTFAKTHVPRAKIAVLTHTSFDNVHKDNESLTYDRMQTYDSATIALIDGHLKRSYPNTTISVMSYSAKYDSGISEIREYMLDQVANLYNNQQTEFNHQHQMQNFKRCALASVITGTISYSTYKIYKHFASKDKDKNNKSKNAKKNPRLNNINT